MTRSQAIRHAHDQQINNRNRSEAGADNVFPVQPRDIQHRHRDDEYFHRRAQVRLEHHQSDQHEHGPDRRQDRALPVVHAESFRAPAPLEKPRQIKNHGELGELGRLQACRAQPNPAMRRVRLIEKENAGQHREHAKQCGENHFRPAQLAIVQIHHGHHSAESDCQPEKLAQQEVRAVAVFVARRDGRSAEHHEGADQAQGQRRAEHPSVGLELPWHPRSPFNLSRFKRAKSFSFCHSERSEESLRSGIQTAERFFASLRMTTQLLRRVALLTPRVFSRVRGRVV